MKRNLQKISITIDPGLVSDLDYVASRLSVSRSSLISEVLPEPLGVLRRLLADLPLNPTPEDVLRFRGDSAEVIRRRIDDLKGMADDLFAEK